MKTDKLRPGDVLLYRGTTIVGELICWWTRAGHCHAAMIGIHGESLEMLYDGGKRTDIQTQAGYLIDVYRPMSRDAEIPQWAACNMERNIRTKYNWRSVLRAGFSFLLRPARRERNRHGLMCSQAVSLAYRQAGLDPCLGLPDAATLPRHLADSPFLGYVGTLEF